MMPEFGDDALQAGLTELNRRLHELKEELTGAGLAAAPLREERLAAPAAPASAPEQRVESIVDAAQRMADEIMSSARRQVAEARQQPASAPAEAIAPAPPPAAAPAPQPAAALQHARELLAFGEELLGSARRLLEHAEAGRPVEAPPLPLITPAPGGDGPRAGVYAAPAAPVPLEAPAAPAEAPVAPKPLLHIGQVTVTAGPLADVAAAAVLERAVERVPAIDRARVRRFVDNRAVIELSVREALPLVEELRRVVPYPFDVQAVGPTQLDIVIAAPADGAGQ